MSNIAELVHLIAERLRIPSEKSGKLGDLYDVQPDVKPGGIIFYSCPSSEGISAIVSEQGDKIRLRFDADGTECLVPREELLGRPN